jgi:2-oxoglutarate ferredoxin oxidoreductase subunit beta
MGVFRSVDKPVYDRMMADQLTDARAQHTPDLNTLLAGNESWTIT